MRGGVVECEALEERLEVLRFVGRGAVGAAVEAALDVLVDAGGAKRARGARVARG